MKVWATYFLSFLLFFTSGNLIAADFSDDGVWQRISENSIQKSGARTTLARSYLPFRLNREILQGILKQAPDEFSTDAQTKNILISVPLPDGSFSKFRIEESPIMQDGLAAKFPEIKTYRGQGVEDPTITVRFGWTSGGFHAFGLTNDRSFYIGAYQRADTENYISYWSNDEVGPKEPYECLVSGEHAARFERPQFSVTVPMTGQTLHTYTTAIAGTGEYTQKFGTKSDALNNGIIPTTNSLNAILEREFTVRLVLVNDEMDIIFDNPSTDPYTANDKFAMLNENQVTIDAEIGNANYDVGHVFGGSGGGGVAFLMAVCNFSIKAGGVSVSGNPSGTGFLVDIVAHEFGHQFNANHSYNGSTSSCGPNRNAGTAYEPGSGSTIMSYSGSCGSENLQGASDPIYHAGSFSEINWWVSNTTCDTETATGNNPPTVNAGSDYTVPKNTPFTLTATGSDTDGDSITYLWEQLNLGAASPPMTDDGFRPIFRTWQPSTSPSRTVPKLADVLDGTLTIGEAWATTDRTVNFHVTARDNHAGGGGVASDTMVLTVENSAGPFVITDPNTNETWTGGTNQTVTWNVAGTNSAPVSTANVRILLSTDGGLTFPTVLVASTANDGSQNVSVPLITSTTARIKVEAIGNIFFDISDTNFTITTSGCTAITVNPASLPNGVVGTAYNQTITATGGTSPYTFSKTSGTIPTGVNLASNGALTGTPTASGNFTFVVTATDANTCTGTRSYTISIANVTCLFCDTFNDGVVSTGWTYLKPDWIETGGFLVGTPASKKAIAVASPIFLGCANCSVEAQMRTDGGPGNRVWLLAWYIDKGNTIELLMKEENDLWILKQKVNGSVVTKMKSAGVINANITYRAKIVFDGTQFQLFIDNALLFSMPKAAGTSPNGTVGFQAKETTARFNSITVN